MIVAALTIAAIYVATPPGDNDSVSPRSETIQATQASGPVIFKEEATSISTTTSTSAPPVTTPSPTTTRELATIQSPTTSQAPQPAPAPTGGPAPADGARNWDAVAQCESGGNWSINTGNGYYGGLQMNMQFWHSYSQDLSPRPERPDLATREQQIHAAENAYSVRGATPWPHCGRYL